MSKPFNLKWSTGNEKLNKDNGGVYNIIGFGIPADTDFEHNGVQYNTCPGALACRGICYAKTGFYIMPNVRKAKEYNLNASLQDTFVQDAISDLRRMRKVNTVRIHDAGDYYNQEYFNKWCQIAQALPHIIFYSYTKALHLDMSSKPDNLRITQSLGGKYDKLVNLGMPHSRIFASEEDRVNAGYVDGNINDTPAIQGLVQIGLTYHGNKNLTESQKKYFR